MRRRTLAVLALVLLPAAACSTPLGSPDEAAVAEDPHATAAEIVEAGHPQDVAVAEGRTMVLYGVSPDDDEGPHQTAWRIYDADGKRVADRSLGQSTGLGVEIDGVADGFLVRNDQEPAFAFVDPDGKASSVRQAKKARPTRPGDVSLWEFDSRSAFYRPADHATYPLRQLPRMTQAVGIDATGTVWAQVPLTEIGPDYNRTVVLHATRGKGPWQRELVRFPGRKAQAHYDLSLADDRVFFSTLTGNAAAPRPAHLMSRGRSGWTAIPLTGVDKGPGEPSTQVTQEGHVLYSLVYSSAWLQRDAGWRRLDVPDAGRVLVEGGRLYRIAEKVSVSDDEGSTWHEIER